MHAPSLSKLTIRPPAVSAPEQKRSRGNGGFSQNEASLNAVWPLELPRFADPDDMYQDLARLWLQSQYGFRWEIARSLANLFGAFLVLSEDDRDNDGLGSHDHFLSAGMQSACVTVREGSVAATVGYDEDSQNAAFDFAVRTSERTRASFHVVGLQYVEPFLKTTKEEVRDQERVEGNTFLLSALWRVANAVAKDVRTNHVPRPSLPSDAPSSSRNAGYEAAIAELDDAALLKHWNDVVEATNLTAALKESGVLEPPLLPSKPQPPAEGAPEWQNNEYERNLWYYAKDLKSYEYERQRVANHGTAKPTGPEIKAALTLVFDGQMWRGDGHGTWLDHNAPIAVSGSFVMHFDK